MMNSITQRLLSLDLLAGFGAAAFAVGAQYYDALTALASPEVAGAFSLLALGRWYAGRAGREEVHDG
jgi:hypothetical protein